MQDADIAASFQTAVVEVLVAKTVTAAKQYGARSVCLAGGVSANQALRSALAAAVPQGVSLHLPSMVYCTDNAAMVGILGYFRYKAGIRAGLDLNATAVLRIESWL